MPNTELETIEAYAARVAGGLEKDIVAGAEAIGSKLAAMWNVEEPYAKAFVLTLFQQETKAAVAAGVAAVPSGNPQQILTAVGTAVVSSIGANAIADVKTEVAAQEAANSANTADASSESTAG